MQKSEGKGLLELGYDIREIDLLLDILGVDIRHCTREIRNIDLILNNEVLLRQERNKEVDMAKTVLIREKTNYLDRRKSCKLLINKITGEEQYKNEELKDE